MKKLLLAAVLFSANVFGQVYSSYPEPMYKSTANRTTALFFNSVPELIKVKVFNADQVTFTVESSDVISDIKVTFGDTGFTTKVESATVYVPKIKKRVDLDMYQIDKIEKLISESITTFLFRF